jgi:dTDP-4-amino-4,6-dideoxygalactose transaminase
MLIPFLELSRESERYRAEIARAVSRVTEAGWYVLGPELAAFEKEFAIYFNVPFAVGVGTGTDALTLALESSGAIVPGEDHEVLTSALSAGFTALAIYRGGAIPRFVDIDPKTLQLNPAGLESLIGPQTRAIVPVHLYGNSCDMEAIGRVAARHGLAIIEDACQAHGARLNGKLLGTLGAAGAFSFYPTKNLGALGDGGMLVTHDEDTYHRARKLRHGGQSRTHYHDLLGRNSRLDEIQAAILRFKLENLEARNQKRRKMAERYDRALSGLDLTVLPAGERLLSNRHLYVVRTPRREPIRAFLQEKGIETLVHYPTPLPNHPAFQRFVLPDQTFPEAEAATREIFSLPLYPELTEDEFQRVVENLYSFFERS